MRRNILALRKKLSAEDVDILSKKIANTLISLDIFKNSEVIALYVPIKNEVDLISLLAEKGKRFLFPRVETGTKKLTFYEAKSPDDFEKGSFNIPEPKTTLNKVDIENIDLFLVPGVAFSVTAAVSTTRRLNIKTKMHGLSVSLLIFRSWIRAFRSLLTSGLTQLRQMRGLL